MRLPENITSATHWYVQMAGTDVRARIYKSEVDRIASSVGHHNLNYVLLKPGHVLLTVRADWRERLSPRR